MPRPRLCRRIRFRARARYFKPRGIPITHLKEIEITREEMEAIKLKDCEGLEQVQAAKQMKTSQSTFQRILVSARKKIAESLIKGAALKIID